MFCPNCGEKIHDDAVICVKCGCALKKTNFNGGKSWVTTLLLCLFTGCIGGHRFYTGHIGIGIAQLFTAGGCGIWALVDLICILCNSFKDVDGNALER